MQENSGKFWGGVMLIAGTAVGAGMLGLPLKTGVSGFFPAAFGLIAGFSFMLLSLFVLLEANFYLNNWDANIISMAKARLGVGAQAVAWFCFLMLLYAALAAYMTEGGGLMMQLWASLPESWQPAAGQDSFYGVSVFLLLFGSVVYFGTQIVDYVNRLLMIGLIGSFCTLVFASIPHVHLSYLNEFYPHAIIISVPVIIASFTSHLILPSLRIYLENDLQQIKKVLLYGSLIPLALYLIWEFIIVGMLPLQGENGLAAVAAAAHPVGSLADAMHGHLSGRFVGSILGGFSFFALVTSFLAVALSLSDFLSDGFGIPKASPSKRLLLLTMTFVPPLLVLILSAHSAVPVFLIALGYLGVFIAVLYGILPALMVWKGRYIENIESEYRAPGGKAALIFLLVGSLAIIAIQVHITMG